MGGGGNLLNLSGFLVIAFAVVAAAYTLESESNSSATHSFPESFSFNWLHSGYILY